MSAILTYNGKTSKWNAAFNPMLFLFLREDFQIAQFDQAQSKVVLKEVLPVIVKEALLDGSATVYVYTTEHRMASRVIEVTDDGVKSTINLEYNYGTSVTEGYVNIIAPGQNIQISSFFSINGIKQKSVDSIFAPDISGNFRVDVSAIFKSLITPKDEFSYGSPAYLDRSLFAAVDFLLQANTLPVNTIPGSFINGIIGTYAAMQLGERHGGNLWDYVTFLGGSSAKFLTDFKKPLYFEGLPYDVAFILSEELSAKDVRVRFTAFDINGIELPIIYGYLLMEDGSYILKEDGGRIILESSVFNVEQIQTGYGIIRLRLPYFSKITSSIDVQVFYVENGSEITITEKLTIETVPVCNDPYVHLKWMNSRGAWDYFRFGYNQDYSSDVDNESVASRFVADWENDNVVTEIIKKSAVDKIKVGADHLSIETAKSLAWLRKSIMVEMLVRLEDGIRWERVIVEAGSFDVFSANKKSSSVKFTITKSPTNIQYQ